MDKLELNDEEASHLIKIIKHVFEKYTVDLSPGNKGRIRLYSIEEHEFIIDYYTPSRRDDKISIHVREKETNVSLVRLNIDPSGFHKNSDGSIIRGNRLLIFSSKEWFQKNDGFTHVKAFNIPDEHFSYENNLEQVFMDYLVYINVKQEGKISFPALL
jgi:hypothetical protein